MRSKVLLSILIVWSENSYAAWTEFKEVGKLQSYGGSVQMWLSDFSCPNSKPYITLSENYISSLDRIISMVLMAKASKAKINVQYNAADDPRFCYLTGIQVE